MAIRAGAIWIDFLGNLAGLDAAFARAEKNLGALGDRLSNVGTKLTAGITVPLAGAGIAASKFAGEFDQTMTRLVTLASVGEGQMQSFRKAVLQLAPAVGRGPNELARALLAIASAGQEGQGALDILDRSARLAAIGLGETESVARALTSVINAYGAKNLSAAKASEILLATVDRGQAEASELAPTLGRVVGIAATLGVTFQEVGAFVATFTRLGVGADEAVTALRGTLGAILAPSEQAKQAFAGMGVTAEQLRKQLAAEGLMAVLNRLIGLTKGNVEQLDAVIPNVRALAGVLGTAGTQAQGYAQNLQFIAGAQDLVDQRFARTQQTTAQAWSALKARAEVAAITVGEQLVPALLQVLPALEKVFLRIAELAAAFGRLPPGIQTAILAAAALAAALGPVLFVAGSLIKAFGALMAVGKALAPVFSLVVTILQSVGVVGGLAAAAALALGLAARQVLRHWDYFRMQFAAIWTAIRDGVFTSVEVILGILAKLPIVGDKFAALRAAVVAEHDQMLAEAGDRLSKLTTAWEDAERKLAGIQEGGKASLAGALAPTVVPEPPRTTLGGGPVISEDLRKAQEEFAQQLKVINTLEAALGDRFDSTAEQANLYDAAIRKLLEAGASLNTVVGPQGETLQTLIDRYQKLQRTVDVVTKAQQHWADMQARAKEIIQETLTPAEQYAQKVAELNQLHEAGLLSAEQFQRGMDAAAAGMGRVLEIGETLRSTIADAFIALGTSLGTIFSGIVDGTENLGTALRKILGTMLQTIGKSLIAVGTAGVAIRSFLVNPFAAIAAGVALVALGSALAASTSKTIAATGSALASGGGGPLPAPAEPSSQFTGQGQPAQNIILEFQDPSNPGVVQKIVASVNRLHGRDATVAVPLAVIGGR